MHTNTLGTFLTFISDKVAGLIDRYRPNSKINLVRFHALTHFHVTCIASR